MVKDTAPDKKNNKVSPPGINRLYQRPSKHKGNNSVTNLRPEHNTNK